MKSSVDNSIRMLLKENGFSEKDEFVKGIVSIVDLIADYHEEGIKYFPEIIISDDADNFNTPLTLQDFVSREARFGVRLY